MDWPTVCVILLTYEPGDRKTAEPTLRSFIEHVEYSGAIDVHIADDGSLDGHVAMLREIAGSSEKVRNVGSTNAHRGGYGRSYNIATHEAHAAAILLPLEDDWTLTGPLNLDALVRTLLEAPSAIECIRLGYLGFTQGVVGTLAYTPAGMMFVFDPESAERHVFSGHPRLETRDYERRVGLWPEGRPAGETEFEVAGRPASRIGVAWPMDLIPPRGQLFAHTGSVSLNQLQPGGAK